MRKRIVSIASDDSTAIEAAWLDLEPRAEIELTSEDPAHPVECALGLERKGGWRATEPGAQTLRLRFDAPQRLTLIHLEFEEREVARTQEFVLRWSGERLGCSDVVRQQYTFSPPESYREVENYTVDLEGVRTLELHIVPSISGGGARASLAQWRIA